jgi:hypothetical protein
MPRFGRSDTSGHHTVVMLEIQTIIVFPPCKGLWMNGCHVSDQGESNINDMLNIIGAESMIKKA